MSTCKVLSIFFSLFTVGLCTSLVCPNAEDVFPCSCKRVAYGLHVVCANFNTSSNLMKAFRNLKDLHTLLLHGLYFQETLPTDLFHGMKIKEIRIEKSELKFPEPAFSGLDTSLSLLNVAQKSVIKSKDSFVLARLTSLNELRVDSTHLEKVEDRWLNAKVPTVHTVVLDDNQITEIENYAFSKLQLLKILSIANNRIRTIQRSMLPRPALYLTRIDFSYNEINILPKDFFLEMPSLKEIILTGNELKSLPESTWVPVWQQLERVFLIDNSLDCQDDLMWMKTYRIPKQLKGNCILPREMAGKSLKDILR